MKKVKHIYPEIYDFSNLYAAYLKARKGKRFCDEVSRYSYNLEENLIDIQNDLIWKTYQVGPYRQFTVKYPKKRLIMALAFRDRVVQWAIYQQLYPIFDKKFIYDSYGCRNGKGALAAAKRLQYWLRQVDRKQEKYYYLKLDISKFFYSINHDVLLGIFKRTIEDPDMIDLLKKVIDSENDVELMDGFTPNCFPVAGMGKSAGIPIGNLTSQLFANVYLNELDQFCKRILKVRYYIRYMDDIIILHEDKQYLARLKSEIEGFINQELGLCLNNKTAIRPIPMGIEFVGYRIWSTHMKIRKKTAIRIKRRLKKLAELYRKNAIDFDEIEPVIVSYFGLLKHCDSYNFQKKLSEDCVFQRQVTE